MNSGAFGENFPYSNFHDLNMDWIVKIVKDFLDQYTHIQQIIADGEQSLTNLTESDLTQLQDKADTLEELLQAWYNTHSTDIAEQLADAIADFNTAAETKSQALLDSWPDDYSELVTGYNDLKSAYVGSQKVIGYNAIEQGGFTQDGLNGDIRADRCRTTEYIPVIAGKRYTISVIGSDNVAVSVSVYSANDYTTPRSNYTAFLKTHNMTMATGVNYIRCIFANANDSSAQLSPREGFDVLITEENGNGNYRINRNDLIMPHITTAVDLNTYTMSGKFSFAGLNHTNTPIQGQWLPLELNVTHLSNDVVIQELTYLTLKTKFIRTKLVNQDWGSWVSLGNGIVIISNAVDLNSLVNPGIYFITGRTAGSTDVSSKPVKDIYDFFAVDVKENVNGAIIQTLTYYTKGYTFYRFKSAPPGNEWSNWKGDAIKIKSFFPVLSEISMKEYLYRERKTNQGLAVYNGHIFEFGSTDNAKWGTMCVDNGNAITIACGHGNNCMFGETLHGNFPYLYCGSFYENTCTVYVNEVTTTSANLVRTITFENLTGYLNMCVDEPNNRMYLLMNVSETTSEGVIDFVTVALDTAEILNTKRLPYTLKSIQDIEFYHGQIYVTVGNNNINLPTKIYILDTTGNIVMESEPLNDIEEFEGISFDNGKMYIASVRSIMST